MDTTKKNKIQVKYPIILDITKIYEALIILNKIPNIKDILLIYFQMLKLYRNFIYNMCYTKIIESV